MRRPEVAVKPSLMTNDHDYQQIDILIPGYSVEDLPTDLNENSAASLLNAFAVAWHPKLLLAAKSIPEWRQAESTELPTGQHIVFIPECSEDWLGHDWQNHFDDTFSIVFHAAHNREDYLQLVDQHFPEGDICPQLLPHFFALGTCHLQVMLLSRKLHHFVDPDSVLLQSEAIAAAQAAIAGRDDDAKDHLRRCFECLLECREQFHPVDCFLVDVCLPSDQTSADELVELLKADTPLSLICCGSELDRYAREPAFVNALTNSIQQKRLSLLTGHQHELRTSLSSLSTLYSDINDLPTWLKALADDSQLHWARRRYGITSSLPSILNHFGFASALHVVLDDGLYPDREYGQLKWQANDGSSIPAVSRIPMAIDGSSSFLRFADRYVESMQEDSNAVLLLARLPEVKTPWLRDLQIAAQHAPVLGQFVTMTDFIDHTGGQTGATKFAEGEYLSPYLIQSSVLKTEAPISSPQSLYAARDKMEALAFLECVDAVLKPRTSTSSKVTPLERSLNQEELQRIDLASTSTAEDKAATTAANLELAAELETAVHAAIATHTPGNDGQGNGLLLINNLPWQRQVSVTWPNPSQLPDATEHSVDAWQQSDAIHLSTELPAGGFLWLTSSVRTTSIKPMKAKGKPLAEHLLLRNQFFEVNLSERTGGIGEVRFHNQRANRVSQHTAFRYENSKTVRQPEQDEDIVCPYATTRMISCKVIQSGPYIGTAETTNEIVDVETQQRLATFRQTFTVKRDTPQLQLSIQFDSVDSAPTGNPWMTYFASRFAWDNESAAITRSMLGQAAGFRMERFDAADYIEVADADQRLLIIPHGRPYHRRTGPRMLDSLLLVEGETAREFQFTLDFDQPFPMRSVMEAIRPAVVLQPTNRIPKAAVAGWILGVSAKNVQAARCRVIKVDDETIGLVIVLQETEGRKANCQLRTVRPPKTARLRRPDGSTIQELTPDANGTLIEFSAFQLKEVELTF